MRNAPYTTGGAARKPKVKRYTANQNRSEATGRKRAVHRLIEDPTVHSLAYSRFAPVLIRIGPGFKIEVRPAKTGGVHFLIKDEMAEISSDCSMGFAMWS